MSYINKFGNKEKFEHKIIANKCGAKVVLETSRKLVGIGN